MKMISRNMTLAGIILLVLAFTIGMAGATDQNTTGNETPAANSGKVRPSKIGETSPIFFIILL